MKFILILLSALFTTFLMGMSIDVDVGLRGGDKFIYITTPEATLPSVIANVTTYQKYEQKAMLNYNDLDRVELGSINRFVSHVDNGYSKYIQNSFHYRGFSFDCVNKLI